MPLNYPNAVGQLSEGRLQSLWTGDSAAVMQREA
jgi:hypothetical protein